MKVGTIYSVLCYTLLAILIITIFLLSGFAP
jgi:hypothetical protein